MIHHKTKGDKKRRLRKKLRMKQGNKCFYCGCQMAKIRNGKIKSNTGTIEHLQRLADGGTYKKSNLVAACARCNFERGEQDWQAYKMHKSKQERISQRKGD